jgi:hypothetical protein
MATEYPTNPLAYLRQQRRWLSTVALHGWYFGATGEMLASLRTSFVGLGMLLLPGLGLLLSRWLLVAWGVLAGQALFARLRYLSFAGAVLGRPVRLRDIVWQGPLLMLDFVTWTRPLIEYARPRERGRRLWVW